MRPLSSRSLLALGATLSLAACSASTETRSAVDRGRALFESTATTDATSNAYTCATCHGTAARGPHDTGAPLFGAPLRRSFWGGSEIDFLRSVNQCRRSFLRASVDLSARDETAEDLTAYLASSPGDTAAQPFTVVRAIIDVPTGNAARGAAVVEAACGRCHGDADGNGRLTPDTPSLRADFRNAHAQYTPAERRLIFIEKVRHGSFLGYGGIMPPFGEEALTDIELADLLAFVGL
jgi:thiosulfate dehydrogenase